MASAVVNQIKNVSDALYQVTTTVTTAVGMEIEVFMLRSSDDTYSHVANLSDMRSYPTESDQGIAFYRVASILQEFTTPTAANAAADLHLAKINELVYEYNVNDDTFDGSVVETTLTGEGV